MKNTKPIIYILFFVLGISFQYGIAFVFSDKTPTSSNAYNKTVQYDNDNFEQSINEKISLLDSKIDSINDSLENLSSAVQSISFQETSSPSTEEKPIAENSHSFRDNSIVSIKDRLYSNLSNPTYTLPDILESEEMTNLPEPEQQKILAEIARRIDSGEIDKFNFLPGYREQAEN